MNDFKRIVLDTHTLIWYLEGIGLSELQVKIIEQQRSINQLYLSAISVWEVAMLINKKKAAFTISMTEWLRRLVKILGLNIIDLFLNILVESCNLPDYEHKDPTNRLIISSTREINGHLLTFDQKILNCAKKGYVKIC